MSISARRARVISVAQTRAATRMLDIVTLTLITITFTLTPPLALLILLFDARVGNYFGRGGVSIALENR